MRQLKSQRKQIKTRGLGTDQPRQLVTLDKRPPSQLQMWVTGPWCGNATLQGFEHKISQGHLLPWISGPPCGFSCGRQVPDVGMPHYRDARMQHRQCTQPALSGVTAVAAPRDPQCENSGKTNVPLTISEPSLQTRSSQPKKACRFSTLGVGVDASAASRNNFRKMLRAAQTHWSWPTPKHGNRARDLQVHAAPPPRNFFSHVIQSIHLLCVDTLTLGVGNDLSVASHKAFTMSTASL